MTHEPTLAARCPRAIRISDGAHRQGRARARGRPRGPAGAGARRGHVSLRVDLLEGGRIALRTLGVNRLRTVLTLTAVGIGVATLLAIVGIIQGLNGAFARQLASLGTATLNISRRPYVVTGDWWQLPEPEAAHAGPDADGLAQQSRLATAVVPEVNEDGKDLTGRRPERERRGPGRHPGRLPEDLGLRGARGSLPDRRGQRRRAAGGGARRRRRRAALPRTEPAGRVGAARQPALPGRSACWPRRDRSSARAWT